MANSGIVNPVGGFVRVLLAIVERFEIVAVADESVAGVGDGVGGYSSFGDVVRVADTRKVTVHEVFLMSVVGNPFVPDFASVGVGVDEVVLNVLGELDVFQLGWLGS